MKKEESFVTIEEMRGSVANETYKILNLHFDGHFFTFRIPEFQYHEDAVKELFKLCQK